MTEISKIWEYKRQHDEFSAVNQAEGMIVYRLQTDKGTYFGKAIIAR